MPIDARRMAERHGRFLPIPAAYSCRLLLRPAAPEPTAPAECAPGAGIGSLDPGAGDGDQFGPFPDFRMDESRESLGRIGHAFYALGFKLGPHVVRLADLVHQGAQALDD